MYGGVRTEETAASRSCGRSQAPVRRRGQRLHDPPGHPQLTPEQQARYSQLLDVGRTRPWQGTEAQEMAYYQQLTSGAAGGITAPTLERERFGLDIAKTAADLRPRPDMVFPVPGLC